MNLHFSIQTKINKPVAEVFEAVVDDKKICGYFTNKTSGPLEEGKTITWHWTNYGDHPVHIKQIIPNQKIVFEWKANRDEYNTQATLEFKALDENTTMLKITEGGWKTDQNGLESSYDNCSGWQHMASSLKVFLEHGIDLRR